MIWGKGVIVLVDPFWWILRGPFGPFFVGLLPTFDLFVFSVGEKDWSVERGRREGLFTTRNLRVVHRLGAARSDRTGGCSSCPTFLRVIEKVPDGLF